MGVVKIGKDQSLGQHRDRHGCRYGKEGRDRCHGKLGFLTAFFQRPLGYVKHHRGEPEHEGKANRVDITGVEYGMYHRLFPFFPWLALQSKFSFGFSGH